MLDRDRAALPGRFAWILLAVAIGVILAWLVALVLYGRAGVAWTSVTTLRSVAAENPPWILLSSLAAAPSLLLTWWWRTVQKDEDFALAKRTERNTRFSEAVKLLAEREKLEARIGGIYSLEALAADATDELPRVLETLCAFVRTRGEATGELEETPPEFEQPADVQIAFSVIGRVPRPPGMRLDLRGAALCKINGEGANLAGALFQHADLSTASLMNANLSGANLDWVSFALANLDHANLKGASLRRARFYEAILTNADLRDTELRDAVLLAAELKGADFTGAKMRKSALAGASLGGSVLPKSWEPEEDGSGHSSGKTEEQG